MFAQTEAEEVGGNVRADVTVGGAVFRKIGKKRPDGLAKKAGEVVDHSAVEGDLKETVIKDDDPADLDDEIERPVRYGQGRVDHLPRPPGEDGVTEAKQYEDGPDFPHQ